MDLCGPVPNSGDSNTRVGFFLRALFERLSQHNVVYCVLRNYKGLPHTVGNDVDLWVQKGHQQRFLEDMRCVATELGWEEVKRSLRPGYDGAGSYFFCSCVPEAESEVVHIDLWTSIYWKAVNFVNDGVIAKHRRYDDRGFFVASPGAEASILLLKDLLYHGRVREKYRERIVHLFQQDPVTFLAAMEGPFGTAEAQRIVSMVQNANWDKLQRQVAAIRWTLLRRGFLGHPLPQIRAWLVFIQFHLGKWLDQSGGFLLILIGPDGSGKSTISQAVLDSSMGTKLFQGTRYFHGRFEYLPELKRFRPGYRNGRASQELPENPSTNGAYPAYRAVIYPLYYVMDYALGHWLVWKSKTLGQLIVFDRYFYDYFLQRQFLYCPRGLLQFLKRFIPQPDALIFLKGSPEVIHDRKPELSVEEIRRQTALCESLVGNTPYGFIVDTLHDDSGRTSCDVQRIIVNQMKNRLRL